METRGLVVLATWAGVTIISSVAFLIGGVNTVNYVFVGILVGVGYITTFGMPFMMGSEPKQEVGVQNKLKNMDMRLEKLTEMVEEIKREIEV